MQYEQPKDFIQLTVSGQRQRYITEQQDNERKQLKEKELNDAFSLCNIKLPEASTSYLSASPTTRSSPKPVKVEYITKKTKNINYHHRENTQKDFTISDSEASTSLSTTPPSVYEFETFEIPENNALNFPVLTPKKAKKTFTPELLSEKKRTNRVIRIVPHKSSPTSLNIPNTPSLSLANR